MANLTTDAFNKVDKVAHNLKDKAAGAEDQLTQMTYDAGKKVGAIASDFSSAAMDYAKNGREYVKENPGKGVAMAAVAGLVTGSLLTLAMRRRH
ncbi:MAG: hypothetical protein JNL11_05795 [Bdellovibrionaceae bacterium]|nr:hypothetical protein [Pseudobdellovibrionaceae bacterium]